jgi:excisionase family DNA binding protein
MNRASRRHPEPETLTVDEAAAKLRISRNHAYKLIADGTIPALRLGRRVLVSRVALDSLLRTGV